MDEQVEGPTGPTLPEQVMAQEVANLTLRLAYAQAENVQLRAELKALQEARQ